MKHLFILFSHKSINICFKILSFRYLILVNIYFYNLWEKKLFGMYSNFQEYDGSRDPKKGAENICYRTECPLFKSVMKSLGPTTKLEKNYPHFWYHLQIWGFPKSVWSFIFHRMEMTGLTTTVILSPLWFIARRNWIKLGMGENA